MNEPIIIQVAKAEVESELQAFVSASLKECTQRVADKATELLQKHERTMKDAFFDTVGIALASLEFNNAQRLAYIQMVYNDFQTALLEQAAAVNDFIQINQESD